MTKSQKAKAKLTVYITYEGEEATTNNISYILKRAVGHLFNNHPIDRGMLTDGFDMEVVESTWDWECDIVEEE